MAIGVGSVVIPAACIAAGTAVIFGTVMAGEAGGPWDVLWENGQSVDDVVESELHEFWSTGDADITHTYRLATRVASGGGAVAPGPDCVGVEVARTASESVIRALSGHRYWLYTRELQYLDV